MMYATIMKYVNTVAETDLIAAVPFSPSSVSCCSPVDSVGPDAVVEGHK